MKDHSKKPSTPPPVSPLAQEGGNRAGQAGQQNPSPKIHPKAPDPELRYKFWELVALYSNLAVAIVGFLGVVWSLNNNRQTLHANTKSLRANVQNAVLSHVVNLDKVFIDKPYLLPYFYEDKPPDPNDHYQEVIATAQLTMDVLDIASVQSTRFRDEWEDPDGWDRWIIDMFKHSPVLRQYLAKHKDWYGQSVRARLEKAQEEARDGRREAMGKKR